MIKLGASPLAKTDIEAIIFFNANAIIDDKAMKKVEATFRAIKKAASKEDAVYGINTGFGALAEVRIDLKNQHALQRNIILSHAVGVGDPLDFFTAKTLMLLRINTLIQGYSGASPALIEHLLRLLNANCAPFIPKKGSVGASGDLAPLAHLGLLLLGIGDAFHEKKLVSASLALDRAAIAPLELSVRDGLALINGTQAMAAIGISALKECDALIKISDIAAAISLDALGGHHNPFDKRIHDIKPHPGQQKTAAVIRSLRRENKNTAKNTLTQDPYSLRCVPQVHGASKDVVAHVQELIYREANAVTDNPLIFMNSDEDSFEILSGGNFHGQHLALALDYLAMGVAELANISERRLALMLDPHHSNGLPAFLIEDSGINSGFMMIHVTATALVSENKLLCHPASVDSIPTSANREDHVSMGMNSANKLMQIIINTKTVLAIEIMAGCQAIDLRPRGYLSPPLQKFHECFREVVSMRHHDGLYRDDLMKTLSWLDQEKTQRLIEQLVI